MKQLLVQPGPADLRPDYILKGNYIVRPDSMGPAALWISDGKIKQVFEPPYRGAQAPPEGISVEDVGDTPLMPGLVDIHVHVNEPAPESHFAGFKAVGDAALHGGITTVIDMPLNSIPVTTTEEALKVKLRMAYAAKPAITFGFHGGLVAGSAANVKSLLDAGVRGIKAFLCHSGLDEFPAAEEADLRAAMKVLAEADAPLLAHAEITDDEAPAMSDPTSIAQWAASRPPRFELRAIELLIRLCRETGCHVHIVHLAAAEALPILAEARAEGLPISVETCPHYLFFKLEDLPDGDARFKCAPPVRDAANREVLWQGLRDGVIDAICSDHSPSHPDLKNFETGDIQSAWGGIGAIHMGLRAVWTEAKQRGFTLQDMARWMGYAPAHIAGMQHRFGSIAPGLDADFFTFDADNKREEKEGMYPPLDAINPYLGQNFSGSIKRRWIRGHEISL